ncbi:MAG TPA: tyrosine-protein phosphatase [Ruminococcus sp.]|nr:tyrosine-protein phosphatase [Ruminococcus sp.]
MYLSAVRNMRAVLPDSLRLIRSDVPSIVNQEDIHWLRENNVLTVIDLRTEAEYVSKPCPLEMIEDINYLHMPVTGGNRIPASSDDVSSSYLAMADEKMENIVRTIIDAENNVLYFCNAGKDRTGVLTAILLCRLGYDNEYIISDYLKTAENIGAELKIYAAEHPDVNIEVITPNRRYMAEFLKEYRKRI